MTGQPGRHGPHPPHPPRNSDRETREWDELYRSARSNLYIVIWILATHTAGSLIWLRRVLNDPHWTNVLLLASMLLGLAYSATHIPWRIRQLRYFARRLPDEPPMERWTWRSVRQWLRRQ